jgi:hypothetical protein
MEVISVTISPAPSGALQALAMEPMTMGYDAVSSRIEEGYLNGGLYSWARELWRNYHQAVQRKMAASSVTAPFTREDVERAFGYTPEQRFDFLNLHRPEGSTGGSLKRVVFNTGPYMTWDEVRDYFASGVGEGHADLVGIDNPLGDRHAGARESTCPWNRDGGIVVVSYHPTEMPEGAKVWIRRDPVARRYGVVRQYTGIEEFGVPQYDKVTTLDVEDELGLNWLEDVIPQTPLAEHGGVMFALLGNDPFADDVDGVDQIGAGGRGTESPTVLVNFLLDHVAEAVGGITVVYRVGPVGTASGRIDKRTSDGTVVPYESRNIYGLEGWVRYGQRNTRFAGVEEGVWNSSDGRLVIDWTLLPEVLPVKDRNMTPHRGTGHIVTRYRDDLHPWRKGSNKSDHFEFWGVPEAKVWKRLRLVLRPVSDPTVLPDGWHVRQNPARSGIVAPDGSELYPEWREWAEEWIETMPTVLAEAIKAAMPKPPGHEKLERDLLERLFFRTAARRLLDLDKEEVTSSGEGDAADGVQIDVAEEEGNRRRPGSNPDDPHPDPTGGGVGTRHRSTPGGSRSRKVKKRLSHLPEPRWFTKEEWEQEFSGDDNAHQMFVRLRSMPDGEGGVKYVLYFNQHHALYRDQEAFFKHWRNAARKGSPVSHLSDDDLMEHVRTAYWMDSASRYFAAAAHHMLDENGVKPDADAVDGLRSDRLRLTQGAEGYINVEHQVRALASGKPKAAF